MKIAIFLAEGFEEIEAISMIDVLRRAEFHVDMISISKDLYVEGAHGIEVQCDEVFAAKDFSNYDMLVLPGGMPGTLHLREHERLCDLLLDFDKQNKYIGAICAAPRILGELGILKGRKATCYPGNEDKLIGCNVQNATIVVDQNIVTGKGPGVAMEFALAIVSMFKETSEVEELRKKMIL